MLGGIEKLSISKYTGEYAKQVIQEEQRFRDLFGKEELEQTRKKYYSHLPKETYLEYLKNEMQRKLEEQDGDC